MVVHWRRGRSNSRGSVVGSGARFLFLLIPTLVSTSQAIAIMGDGVVAIR